VLCLAHCPVLLAPAKDTLGHLSTNLRDLIADVTGGAGIDCALRRLPVLVRLSFCAMCGVTLIRRSAAKRTSGVQY
jgi:hypothetical protein